MRLKIDGVLFGAVLVLTVLGLVFVYSASAFVAVERYRQASHYFFVRQLIYAATGLGLLVLFSLVDYRWFRSPQAVFLGLGSVLGTVTLAAVLGSRGRFLEAFGAQVQPSEFAKPATAIYLAWLAVEARERIQDVRWLVPRLLPVGLLCAVIGYRDLGNAAMVAVITAVVLFLAGLRWKHLMIMGALAAMAACLGIVSEPYRLKRVVDHLDPQHRLARAIGQEEWLRQYLARSPIQGDTGYQAHQAELAIGAGGLAGRGIMQGTQKLLFLPEAHTDCIYAIVGEELGLLGTLGVLAGFGVIFWRGSLWALRAPDRFGTYLSAALTVGIVVQALLNMTVVLNLGPTKGIPMPLLSYGGSCMWSTMVSLGMIMSVGARSESA